MTLCPLVVEYYSLWAPADCVKPPPAKAVKAILWGVQIMTQALLERQARGVNLSPAVKLGGGQQAEQSGAMEQDIAAQDTCLRATLGEGFVLMPHQYGVQPVQGCLTT